MTALRLSPSKYVNGVRGAIGEDLTPAQLQPLILLLLVKSAEVREVAAGVQSYVTQVRGMAENEYAAVLESVVRDLDRYDDRLGAYLEWVNAKIAEGEGDSVDAGAPVERPLLWGEFPKGGRTGGDPLCMDPEQCAQTFSDLATPVMVMNELAVLGEFTTENWQALFADIEENARAAGEILAGPAAEPTAEALQWLVENSPANMIRELAQDVAKAKASPLKMALIGGGVALGGLALFRLLK